MGINYQRLYDYRLSGVDQALRRPSGGRSPSTRTARPAGLPGVLDPGAGGCEFINTVPAAERWAVDILGVKPG